MWPGGIGNGRPLRPEAPTIGWRGGKGAAQRFGRQGGVRRRGLRGPGRQRGKRPAQRLRRESGAQRRPLRGPGRRGGRAKLHDRPRHGRQAGRRGRELQRQDECAHAPPPSPALAGSRLSLCGPGARAARFFRRSGRRWAWLLLDASGGSDEPPDDGPDRRDGKDGSECEQRVPRAGATPRVHGRPFETRVAMRACGEEPDRCKALSRAAGTRVAAARAIMRRPDSGLAPPRRMRPATGMLPRRSREAPT
jgi:hypothetical protein